MSGPNSISHDFTSMSQRDTASSQLSMLRTTSQEDSLENNQEQQTEHLRTEISAVKASYRSKNGVWQFCVLFSLTFFLPTFLGILKNNFCNSIKYNVTKIAKINDT